MIRKFQFGILMNYKKPKGMMVCNTKHGPRVVDSLCELGNQIYNDEHQLLAPDILSWWIDD